MSSGLKDKLTNHACAFAKLTHKLFIRVSDLDASDVVHATKL